MSLADNILEAHGLVCEFKGFRAVDGVNFAVRRGEIHALIGPNGAGKTTCFNLLSKFLQPTAGTILFKGEDITQITPQAVARRGLVRSFQISAVFPTLTAVENVCVALQRKTGLSFSFWRSRRALVALRPQAIDLLAQLGLASYQDTPAAAMPYGSKRALEIATTLALDPELLLLDEPTQGMGHEDVDRVMNLIKQVAQQRTVLMVEHNMKVVAGISNTITVLARGAVLASGDYATVSANAQVIEAYMGTEAGSAVSSHALSERH